MDAAKNMASSATDTASSTVNSATDYVKGTADQASKEGNKQVAKDSDADASTRATAAKDAVGDKAGELKNKS